MTTTTTATPAGARALLPLLACAALADLGAAQMSVNAMLAALSGNPPPEAPLADQRLKTEAPAPATPGVASFGLGCFWGGQISFDCAEGVSTTLVGYMGGASPAAGYAPAYTDYAEHGYTETVQMVYDAESSQAAYSALLEVFWATHSPTSAVAGSAYRSVIFAHNDQQAQLARRAIAARNVELASGAFSPGTPPVPRCRCPASQAPSEVASMLTRCVLAPSQRRCAALAAPKPRALPVCRAMRTVALSSQPWSRQTACLSGRQRITTRTGTRSSARRARARAMLAHLG